jgi:wyosine [tRNA(Phe)-imidazoG37] synthetase (radical SAM superfamily)
MRDTTGLIAFGPVPSRRLGHSLGINNIPPKSCTYSCVYCQVGRTRDMATERRKFYAVDDILREVGGKISKAGDKGETIDYLTFVPDGEPALDIDLGRAIAALKPFGIKIAVITNASLMSEKSVRDDLCLADWVSVKVDAVREDIWRKVNRPHGALKLDTILKGISVFSDAFRGVLATETMLVRDLNDKEDAIKETADFIRGIRPSKSYISIPTRPPAEKEVEVPAGNVINRAYQIFDAKGIDTEYLIGYEGNDFAYTGDARQDLLSILSVHPMKEEAVKKFLTRSGKGWSLAEDMIRKGELRKERYRHQNFYMREI